MSRMSRMSSINPIQSRMSINPIQSRMNIPESENGEINPIVILALIIGLALIIYLIYYALSPSRPQSSPVKPPSNQPTTIPPTQGPNIQTYNFYNSNGDVLPRDNPCYRCATKNNPCACYVNNNCIVDNSFPESTINQCNNNKCLRYEKQDENGIERPICKDDVLDKFKQLIDSDTSKSYLCKGTNKIQTCINQCKQGDYPFDDKLNGCSSCCEEACKTISCDANSTTMPPTQGPTTIPPTQLLFYSANGDVLPQDNPCYRCATKNNPCACYVNNNCSIDMSLPEAMKQTCNDMMKNGCLRYEKQDENGINPAVCNDDGLNMFKQIIASDTSNPKSYLCKTSADKVKTCIIQCEQGNGPFRGVPSCSSCCEKACQTISCPTMGQNGTSQTFAPPPQGNVPACSDCKILCRLNSPYCDECNSKCV